MIRLEERIAMLKDIIEEERSARLMLEQKLEALDATISPFKVISHNLIQRQPLAL